MNRYLKAELKRMSRRKPRVVLTVLIMIVALVLGLVAKGDIVSECFSEAFGYIGAFGLIFSIINLIFVFGDDFKAGVMKVAMGSGLKRSTIVHTKLVEFAILTGIDLVASSLMMLAGAALLSNPTGGIDVKAYVITLFITWFKINAYLIISAFLIYASQGILPGIIAMALFQAGLVPSIIGIVGKWLHLSRFHLQTYMLSSLIGKFEARLLLGHISWFSVIGIALYLTAGFLLVRYIFKKKEIEF